MHAASHDTIAPMRQSNVTHSAHNSNINTHKHEQNSITESTNADTDDAEVLNH